MKKKNIWEIKSRTISEPKAEQGILTAELVRGTDYFSRRREMVLELSDLVGVGIPKKVIGPHRLPSNTKQYDDALCLAAPPVANAYYVMGLAYNAEKKYSERKLVMAVQYYYFKEKKYLPKK